MKKTIGILIALLLAFSMLTVPALAEAIAPNESAAHLTYSGTAPYGTDGYLYDTLTIAGAGVSGIQAFTVSDLEAIALDPESGVGYENEYSLMTSGSVFSKCVFSGFRLYDFLREYCGLDDKLPDSTEITTIAKDGYTNYYTLGQIKSLAYSRYSYKGAEEYEETGLPILIAFGSRGLPLVGPTGTEPVTKRFYEQDGFIEAADNIGGPLRLIMGQAVSTEFNAPNCSKWLAAIVVGDPQGYEYQRSVEDPGGDVEPEQDGDWTHSNAGYEQYLANTLTVSGTEAAGKKVYTLAQLEAMREGIVRQNFAASAGRNGYEGLILRYLIEQNLGEGIERPTKITLVAKDGYKKALSVNAVFEGINSHYQPGKHRDIILAYAIDGAPMVPAVTSEGYTGANAYGPLRLIVENTISAWVKDVDSLIIGEEQQEIPRPASRCPGRRNTGRLSI